MHRETRVAEHIDRPIPAIRRFNHDLAVRAGPADLLEQPERVVRDPHTINLLAVRVHRVDHRPATIQINPDVTSTHRGLPSSQRGTG